MSCACVVGNKRLAGAQGPADAAAASVRQRQPVSEVAVDVQVRLHVQLGETDERYRLAMTSLPLGVCKRAKYRLSLLTQPRLAWYQLTPFHLNRVRCDWSSHGASQRTTQFSVAATNHSALRSDGMRSIDMRSGKMS